MRLLIFKLLVLTIGCVPIINAQNSYPITSSEMVFFNNEQLAKSLGNIICDKNACQDKRKKINWYVDFKEDNIVLTQGRIANLMELSKAPKRKIFTTVINDNIVFVLMDNEKNLLSKTGFSVNLKGFINKSTIAFEDFSVWLIKEDNKTYRLIDSQIRKCN